MRFLQINLDKGATFSQNLDADDNAFIYVLSGSGRFGANDVHGQKDNTLWTQYITDSPSTITMHADEPMVALLLSGKPLREPVVSYGPFVMNSESQIRQAISDFQQGDFGYID